MGTEYELKFSATPAQQEAVLSAFAGWHRIAMETTYYDTLDGALSQRHWTLRRRTENNTIICALKTPAQDNARWEWEVEALEITEAIKELCKLGAPAELETLCASGIIPICGAGFTRYCLLLPLGEGALELAVDNGILVGSGRKALIGEIEVELKEGLPADADSFAALLQEKYQLVREPRSKFARALALYKGE